MTRKILCVILAFLIAFSLSSCSKVDALLNAIGFDTADYESESVKNSLDTESEEAQKLAKLTLMLTINTPSLPEFSSASGAIKLCRDSILNYMLSNNYSRYTGNLELLDSAAQYYPAVNITNVIPGAEFEEMFYTYFGGSTKISNKSGTYFMYLDKIGAYSAVASPQSPDIAVNLLSCDETEHTYRMRLNLTLGETTSKNYSILLIKREDTTTYFRSVKAEE